MTETIQYGESENGGGSRELPRITIYPKTSENGASSGGGLDASEAVEKAAGITLDAYGVTMAQLLKNAMDGVPLNTWVKAWITTQQAGPAAAFSYALEIQQSQEIGGAYTYQARVLAANGTWVLGQTASLVGGAIGSAVAAGIGVTSFAAVGIAFGGALVVGALFNTVHDDAFHLIAGGAEKYQGVSNAHQDAIGLSNTTVIPDTGTQVIDTPGGQTYRYFEDAEDEDSTYVYVQNGEIYVVNESVNGGNDTLDLSASSVGLMVTMGGPVSVGGSTFTPLGEAMDSSGNLKAVFDNVEALKGTNQADYILGGNDTVSGDTIDAGSGNDGVYGLRGADSISGGAGDDTLLGGKENDTLKGGAGDNTLAGGEGNDMLYAYENPSDSGYPTSSVNTVARVYGGAGNDTLVAGPGSEVMMGGAGSDAYQFNGYFGVDVIQDSDQQGALYINGVQVTEFVSEEAPNGSLTYNGGVGHLSGSLSDYIFQYYYGPVGYPIAHQLDIVGPNGAIVLSDWSPGDFGISFTAPTVNNVGVGAARFALWDSLVPAYSTDPSFIYNRVFDTDLFATWVYGGAAKKRPSSGTGDYDEAADTAIDAADFGADAPAYQEGTDGADSMTATSTTNASMLAGGLGADTLTGGTLGDTLLGGDDNDSLVGAGDDDVLSGDAGNDTMAGGAGDDTYYVETGDTVTESASEGTDTVMTQSSSLTLGTNVENLTLLDASNLNGTGNTLANIITGNDGNNSLAGSDGNDTIYGGGGNDTLKGELGNDVLSGGDGNDTFSGSSGTDSISGDSGDDTLQGGLGNDTLDGGFGIDVLSYVSSGAAVSVNLGTGSVSGADAAGDVFSNVENLTGSAYNDTLTGDDNNNVILGLAGNDSISGGAGNDTVEGGTGNDTLDGGADGDILSYAGSSAGVTVNLGTGSVSGGDAAGDSITGFEGVTGSTSADSITGTGGDDTITGGAGADTLTGGSGNDTLSYAGSSAAITLSLSAQTVTGGDGTGDSLSGFEHAVGSAYADSMTGGSAANRFEGGDGNDTVSSGGGEDTLIGGAGNDSLHSGLSDTTSDILDGGDGDDTMTGGAGNNLLTGGSGNDSIAASGGNDTLDGGAGADTLDGGSGTDTLTYAGSFGAVNVNLGTGAVSGGDAAGDVISNADNALGSWYDDTLTGNSSANVLSGDYGNDSLVGGGGNDTLTGGAGVDSLTGNSGADSFVYTASTDSGIDSPNRDVIGDFVSGSDTIDLSVLTGTFAFIGTGAFDANGSTTEIRYVQTGGNTIVEIDSSGDGTKDFEIQLTGTITLVSGDFVL